MLDRFDEIHTVRTYTVPEMRDLLARGGFQLQAVYAATNEQKQFRPPRPSTFRVMVVARPKQS
jgi:cytolysin (calcineurin-like family phosphatase)